MVQQKNIWKFNDNDWKVHIEDRQLLEKICKKFNLEGTTQYYNKSLDKEFAWDIIVPDKLITKVKRFIKETT